MATLLTDDEFRSGAGQLDGTLVGKADIGGRDELVELEEICGGGGNFGRSSSKLVQSEDGLIGGQQDLVWSRAKILTETKWLDLHHLEERNRAGAEIGRVQPVCSPHEDGDLTEKEIGG
jgi:hypothetical protein